MKKVLLLSSVIIILGLTGCSNKYFNDWFSSEQNETDKMCQQIIEACKQQDSEKLKSLFSEESKKNIENLDTEISAFFDYIEGSIQSFEGDCASSSESNYGKRKTELDGMYLILTEKERYCMKLDIENPIIRINTAFKGCSSLEKISVLPRIYHN